MNFNANTFERVEEKKRIWLSVGSLPNENFAKIRFGWGENVVDVANVTSSLRLKVLKLSNCVTSPANPPSHSQTSAKPSNISLIRATSNDTADVKPQNCLQGLKTPDKAYSWFLFEKVYPTWHRVKQQEISARETFLRSVRCDISDCWQNFRRVKLIKLHEIVMSTTFLRTVVEPCHCKSFIWSNAFIILFVQFTQALPPLLLALTENALRLLHRNPQDRSEWAS